jgi:PAS domain S-box-containing protein
MKSGKTPRNEREKKTGPGKTPIKQKRTAQNIPEPATPPEAMCRPSQISVPPISRKMLQGIIDTGHNPLVYLDRDFNFIAVNKAYARTCNCQPEDIVGKNHFALYPDAGIEALFKKVRDTGEPVTVHNKPYTFPDQPERVTPCWDWTLTPDKDHKGRVQGLVFSLEDTTDRKRAEAALKENKEKYQTIADFTYDWELWMDPRGRFIYSSPSCERITGYGPETFLEKPDFLESIVHPDDRAVVSSHLKEEVRIKNTSACHLDFRIIDRRGDERWISHICAPVLMSDGQYHGRRSSNRDITAQKIMESALRESEERFRKIFENSALGVTLTAPDFRFLQVNQAFSSMMGYSREELTRMSFTDITHPENLAPDIDQIKKLGSGDIPLYRTQKRYIRKDGGIVWASLTVSAIRANDNSLLFYVAQVEDISERKKVELALHESEQRFSNAFQYSAIGIALVSAEGRFIRSNQSLCEMTGYSEEEIKTLTFQDITHPDDLETDLEFVRQMLEGRIRTYQMEKRYIHKSGSIVWVLLSVSLVRDNSGEPLYFISQIENITARKRAEDALRQAGRYNRSLIEASPDPLVTIAEDGRITDVNRAAETVTGYSRNEMIGTDFSGYFTDPEGARRGYKKVFSNGTVRDYPLEIRHRNGAITSVLYNATVFHDESGRIQGVFAAARDITEHKKIEDELKANEKKYRDLVTTLNEGVWFVSPDHITSFVNPRMAKMLGYSAEEMIGRPIIDFLDPLSIQKVMEMTKRREQGHSDSYEVKFRRKDGRRLIGRVTASPLRDDAGKYCGSISGVIDITTRKHYEDVLALSNQIFSIANRHTEIKPLLDDIVREIQRYTGCEAVGIRLLDPSGNIPYPSYVGFDQSFYDRESPLNITTDECMCIYVIRGDAPQGLPVISAGGSFYCNGTTEFLAGVSDEEKGRTRNVCNEVGFESVALVAIKRGETILGLVHLADHRKGMVPIDIVRVMEDISQPLGSSIQRILAESEIRKSLKEKEILLREIHHRVKNNLTGIISMIELQLGHSGDPVALSQMKDLETRIRSMALVHESLYKTPDLSEIRFQTYCRDLMNHLAQLYGDHPNIRWTIDMENITLPIDLAIPCGMIVSEITTNAFKYAFPIDFSCTKERGETCTISMSMKRDGTRIVLTIADNGIGLPANLAQSNPDTLGLRLIHLLVVNQLQGNLDISTDQGTVYTISFSTAPREDRR